MPLTEDVRSELAAIEPRRACCSLAELSALVRTAGSLHLLGAGRLALHLDLAWPATARRAFALLRRIDVPCEIRAYTRRAFGRETRYQLHLGDDPRALQALNEAGVIDARLAPLESPPRRVVSRSCCRASYLRGAFLARGYVTGPPSALLELRTAGEAGASFLAALASEEGIALSVQRRARHSAAYAKGLETIADLLGFVGAHEAALRLGEGAVVGSTRARANRLANADHANLVRTSKAANGQLRAIRKLASSGRLEVLSRDLREAAELRRLHPALSLRELGLKCRPPATKTAVYRRLKRIERLAES